MDKGRVATHDDAHAGKCVQHCLQFNVGRDCFGQSLQGVPSTWVTRKDVFALGDGLGSDCGTWSRWYDDMMTPPRVTWGGWGCRWKEGDRAWKGQYWQQFIDFYWIFGAHQFLYFQASICSFVTHCGMRGRSCASQKRWPAEV